MRSLQKETLDYGRSLLHNNPWVKGFTFGRIAEMYVDHVCKKYDRSIVFDGYDNGPFTIDQTNHRHTKGILGTKVIFTKDTPFRFKTGLFLRSYENKKNHI